MKIYSFQNEEVIRELDKLEDDGMLFVDFQKTNLYKNNDQEETERMFLAYKFMADKLGEKTGICPEINGQKVPPLPWWGWYLVDGKNQKPSKDYNMSSWGSAPFRSPKKAYLLTLEIPEKVVLLSDVNAFYNCLANQPCYDYLSEAEEKKAREALSKKWKKLMRMKDPVSSNALGEEIYNEIVKSWENIFIVDGSRRLKSYEEISPVMAMFLDAEAEKFDVQAAFPFLAKRWIQDIEEVR